jgi:glycosyltransferase involved in cell wall biosynthesis
VRTLHIDFGRGWRGGQRQCALLCGHLARMGHATHLVGRRDAPLLQAMQDSGASVHTLSPAGEADPFALHRLARLLRDVRPDLIAAHEAHAWGLAALARGAAGSRAALVYHRRIDRPLRGGWLAGWKLRRTARFLCVSEAIGEILAAQGIPRERIRVVHSGTPGYARVPGAREELRHELALTADTIILGSIGGLIPHKGHAVLLTAFAQIATEVRNAILVLVGEGPLRDSLRRQTESLGLTQRVHLLGERRDLDRLLSAMDLLVHPSLTEGLGTTLLDANSLAVPVVATRTGGIPEIVRDGATGGLVTPGDPRSLAEGILSALRESERTASMAAAARALHASAFTDRTMAEGTLACYAEILEETA